MGLKRFNIAHLLFGRIVVFSITEAERKSLLQASRRLETSAFVSNS